MPCSPLQTAVVFQSLSQSIVYVLRLTSTLLIRERFLVSGGCMTKPEFQELHDSYADALQKYLAAANQLCTMLGDLAEYSPGIEQWGVIEAQWSLENHLFD